MKFNECVRFLSMEQNVSQKEIISRLRHYDNPLKEARRMIREGNPNYFLLPMIEFQCRDKIMSRKYFGTHDTIACSVAKLRKVLSNPIKPMGYY